MTANKSLPIIHQENLLVFRAQKPDHHFDHKWCKSETTSVTDVHGIGSGQYRKDDA